MSFRVPKHVSVASGEGIHLVSDTYSVLLSSEEASGKMGMTIALVPAMAGPPAHTYHNEDECFILTEGRLEVTAGDQTYEVAPGGVVYIPQGTSHTYRNLSETDPAKMIAIFAPAVRLHLRLSTAASRHKPSDGFRDGSLSGVDRLFSQNAPKLAA